MTAPRTPGVHDFRRFFRTRLGDLAPEEELVWISNTVPVPALLAGYPLGVFPWPGEDPDWFPWVCPTERGVLPIDRFRLGKSTRRQLARRGYAASFDRAFDRVVAACHLAHEPDSWIHPRMRAAYSAAHRRGVARSVEVWEDGELVGGLYGMDSGHLFSGESMFHRRPNAGKAAIVALVEDLRGRGHVLLDIQQLTPHMAAMGAEAWSREDFLRSIRPAAGA